MNEATTEWLTAAECAFRTGLTVRVNGGQEPRDFEDGCGFEMTV